MSAVPKGLRKCHHPNVSSVVLREGPYMVRAFLADDASGTRTVAPHTHRTSLRLTVLRGRVLHRKFWAGEGDEKGLLHTYRSPLLGGEGLSVDATWTTYSELAETFWDGGSLVLPHNQLHTVEWGPDAIWLVQEGPLMTETTSVLIRPGVDDMSTDELYEPMADEEYRERCDLVWRLAAAAGVVL